MTTLISLFTYSIYFLNHGFFKTRLTDISCIALWSQTHIVDRKMCLVMSDWNPLDEFRNKCNDMCNGIWKYIDTLSEHINSLPEGQSKQYLQQNK